MSPDISDDSFEDRSSEPPADAKTADAEAPVASRRRPSTARSSTRRRGKAGVKIEEPVPDDAGERVREHAADALAAMRGRIVERPLQAVLAAAAAGALAALLLGATRR